MTKPVSLESKEFGAGGKPISQKGESLFKILFGD